MDANDVIKLIHLSTQTEPETMKKRTFQRSAFKFSALTGIILILVLTVYFSGRLILIHKHQKDIYDKNGRLRLLTYGLPRERIYLNASRVIAYKYGFSYTGVAGCIVNQTLVDSVHDHNELVESILKSNFGNDWRIQFKKQIDLELVKEQIVHDIIDRQPYVIKYKDRLKKVGNSLDYDMTPIARSDSYLVNAEGWRARNEKEEYITYFKLKVDYQTKQVKLLSDTIRIQYEF